MRQRRRLTPGASGPPSARSTLGPTSDRRSAGGPPGKSRLPAGRSADGAPDQRLPGHVRSGPGRRARTAPGWPDQGAAMRRQCPEPAVGQRREHVTMTAEPSQNPVTEAVRSLEVRWIFPGQLETAVARWFSRFPATTESREDTYLLDPHLPGLSVKVRAGATLEVKAYRGSPGTLQVPGRARGRMQAWQKWSFPGNRPAPAAATRPAGSRSARRGVSAGSRCPAGRPRQAARGRASSRGAKWNSPRSAPAARTGGPWASRRPAPPNCSAANSRPPPRSCSPTPCPAACNPDRTNPGPTRNGCPRPGAESHA